MKIILFSVSCFACSFVSSQVKFDIEDLPNLTTVVDAYILKDGSFNLYYDHSVFAYDKNGVLLEGPKEYDFKMTNVYFNSVIDYSKDIRYTYEPNVSYSTLTNPQIPQLPKGEIMIEYLKDRKIEMVSFDKPTDVMRKKTEGLIPLPDFYSYIADNGNPVFVHASADYSRWHQPKEKKNKDDYYSYVERKELDLATKEVKVTVHLINKVPNNLASKHNSSVGVIGRLNGKLFASIHYVMEGVNSAGRVEIWSIDENTNEENLEYSYNYDLGEIENRSIGVAYTETHEKIFYQIPYLSKIEQINEKKNEFPFRLSYKILEINKESEVKLIEIDIPSDLLAGSKKIEYPPSLTCFESPENVVFFLNAESNETPKIVTLTMFKDESVEFDVMDGSEEGCSSLLVLEDSKLGSLGSKELFGQPDQFCHPCVEKYFYTYRKDENGVYRLLRIGYGMRAYIKKVRVAYDSE